MPNFGRSMMKTLVATVALAAVIASPAFAQTATRRAPAVQQYSSQYDQPYGGPRVLRVRATKPTRSTRTASISVPIRIRMSVLNCVATTSTATSDHSRLHVKRKSPGRTPGAFSSRGSAASCNDMNGASALPISADP